MAWKGLIRTQFKLKKHSTQPTSNSNTNCSTSVSIVSHFRMLLGVGKEGVKNGQKTKLGYSLGQTLVPDLLLSEAVATEIKQSCPPLVLKALTKRRGQDRCIFTTGVKGAEFLELWTKPGGTFPLRDMRHSRKYSFQFCVCLVCALKHLLCFSTQRAW